MNKMNKMNEEPDWVQCPHCGEDIDMNEDDSGICPSCGKPMYDDDSDVGDDTYPFTVNDIEWDVDDKRDLRRLPRKVTVDVPMECVDNGSAEVEEYISDYLSDTYGFCHKGFSVDGLESEPVDESIDDDLDEITRKLEKLCRKYYKQVRAGLAALEEFNNQAYELAPTCQGNVNRVLNDLPQVVEWMTFGAENGFDT